MARVRLIRVALWLTLLACCWLVSACGIKSYPIEKTKLLPVMPGSLEATPVSRGVEVSFWVPAADKPDQRIVEATLYYGYIPVAGLPECPPCPPRLTKFHVFDVTKHLEGLEGGRFAYLDTAAPLDMQAVYQVIITDAAGRSSNPSGLAHAFRVTPPATPTGLTAQAKQGQIELTWKPVEKLADGAKPMDPVAYLVFRKGPDGERQLTQRPLSAPPLVDKTIMEGQTYSYRVTAVRLVRGTEVAGESTAWLSTSTRQQKTIEPPSGLAGVSQADGVYLRFTPSPTQDTAGYYIERQDKKGGPWSRLNAQPWPENTFVDKDVQKGGIYLYRVSAVDDAGQASPPTTAMEIRHQP